MDSMYTFPGLVLAIAIAQYRVRDLAISSSDCHLIYPPPTFLSSRGQTVSVKQELRVETARSLGTPIHDPLEIYPPQCFSIRGHHLFCRRADAILTVAGLSFLGLGLPPNIPDWGIDLARGKNYVRGAWWLITFPGLMVTLVTLSFSMLGESLSEILNPRLAEL